MYIKPNQLGGHHSSNVFSPNGYKKAVIRSEFRRAMRISSDAAASSRSCMKIQELFEANGYSKQLVRRLHRESAQTPRGQPVNEERRRNRGQHGERKRDGYLTLPYIDQGICANVNSIVKKSNLNLWVAWRSNNSVTNRLVRSAFCRTAVSVWGKDLQCLWVWPKG